MTDYVDDGDILPLEAPLQDDSDNEEDWEEVLVPAAETEENHLEITLVARPKANDSLKKKGMSQEERIARITCHKLHTIALLVNARVRNTWINDELLQARLLSLAPLSIHNSFAMIHKSRVPEQGKRGRMFEQSITRMAEWWYGSFFEVRNQGHIRSRTFDWVQKQIVSVGINPNEKAAFDDDILQEIMEDDGEVIKAPKSLMKHALMQSGSRDTSAQLFTALCRALDIPSRLIVSLQSVPWQAGIGKPKPKYVKKAKGKEKVVGVTDEPLSPSSSSEFIGEGSRFDGAPAVKSEKAKGKEREKPPPVTLRKSKSKGKGNVLGASPSRVDFLDPTIVPPVFWTEVFSRPDGRWLAIDPLRGIVNKPKLFDPSSVPGSSSQNRMVYVIALEEDGFGRDVTRRYAHHFGAKVAKVQGGSSSTSRGKAREVWWEHVVGLVTRPYRLQRDDTEDAELDSVQLSEGMPTSFAGFKDHPLYVLPRHLKQSEVIYPPPPETPELGKFRGEPVYPRSSIVALKTAENWMRSEGRGVIEGSQALKIVKVRPGTIGRMRELEIMKENLTVAGEDEPDRTQVVQGLYARSQTKPYIPPPVTNGKIPKNDFGNIDLYVPSMLPAGAVHIPLKGVAKIARKLGFDYAEAVTGFEFKKRRAYPILEGVVVATEHEPSLLEAFSEAERDAQDKAQKKKQERAIKHWTRLIHGLRIRKRLQEQYAKRAEPKNEGASELSTPKEITEVDPQMGGGGFFTETDNIVKAYHLPKFQHLEDKDEPIPAYRAAEPLPSSPNNPHHFNTADFQPMDIDPAEEEIHVPIISRIPKTLADLAEEDVSRTISDKSSDIESKEEYLPPPVILNPSDASSKVLRPLPAKKGNRIPQKQKGTAYKNGRKRTREKKAEDSDTGIDDEVTPSRKRKSAKVVPAPTRTLRPRDAKSKARIQKQLEEEESDVDAN